MDWRVGEDHARRVAEDPDALVEEWRINRHAGKAFIIAQDGERVLIAADQRHREEKIQHVRRAAIERLVMRIWIGAIRFVPRIEIDGLGWFSGHGRPPSTPAPRRRT